MRRREFITLGRRPAAAWPLAARGQPADRVRRIGWLHFFPESDPGSQVHAVAFRQGMEKLDWSVGRNLVIDYRWGAFNVERARVIAAELLNLAPDVIVSGGTPGALAFQQITRTVPIVFAVVTEPVTQGIVQSLAHPGGNMTGFSYVEPPMGLSGWSCSRTLRRRSPVLPLCSTRMQVLNPGSFTNRWRRLLQSLRCRRSWCRSE